MDEKKHIFAFAGGGSGGHCYPLLAIALELKKNYPNSEIYFVTTKKSVEEKIIQKSGFPFHTISSGKVNAQSLFVIVKTIVKLPLAFLESIWIVLRCRPNFVISAGGYAGAPFLIMAALLGVPCIVYEQNRKPGMANRWMSKFSDLVLLNFSQTKTYFVGKKTAVVGLPFRKNILNARWSEEEMKKRISENPFRIFVFGGSQGAVAINRFVLDAIDHLKHISSTIFIHHQTGEKNFVEVQNEYRKKNFSQCLVEPYIFDMPSAYNAAHIVICRAGASSLVELAAAGKTAILVPLVSKDNHQVPNAEELAKKNAAVVVYQNDCDGKKMAAIIEDFYNNRDKISDFSRNIAATMIENAEEKILQEVRELL